MTHERISIPREGDIAPGFESYSTSGMASLALFKGKNIVLYFYPRAITKGCIIQAMEFSKLYAEFKELDTIIMGASIANLAYLFSFCKQTYIPYTLLAGVYGDICGKYGAIKDRRMTVNRTTFLISKDWIISKIWYDVNPLGHAGKVLDALKTMEMMSAHA